MIENYEINIIWYHSYVESLKKNDTKALLYKRETESLTQKTNLWSPVGGYKLGDWNWHIHTAIYKTDNK